MPPGPALAGRCPSLLEYYKGGGGVSNLLLLHLQRSSHSVQRSNCIFPLCFARIFVRHGTKRRPNSGRRDKCTTESNPCLSKLCARMCELLHACEPQSRAKRSTFGYPAALWRPVRMYLPPLACVLPRTTSLHIECAESYENLYKIISFGTSTHCGAQCTYRKIIICIF